MKRIVILISGRGSNMEAIQKACMAEGWPASVVAVISNRPQAGGLAWAQAQGIAESDFPIDAFPAKVQCVILGMVRHENFKVEYLAAAMLSAAASALGNTYNIRVKGHWTTNAALYIIMVGRPGLGKTPPLEAVFRPLRKRDCRALEKFKAEMAAYQNTTNYIKKCEKKVKISEDGLF